MQVRPKPRAHCVARVPPPSPRPVLLRCGDQSGTEARLPTAVALWNGRFDADFHTPTPPPPLVAVPVAGVHHCTPPTPIHRRTSSRGLRHGPPHPRGRPLTPPRPWAAQDRDGVERVQALPASGGGGPSHTDLAEAQTTIASQEKLIMDLEAQLAQRGLWGCGPPPPPPPSLSPYHRAPQHATDLAQNTCLGLLWGGGGVQDCC